MSIKVNVYEERGISAKTGIIDLNLKNYYNILKKRIVMIMRNIKD